MASFKVDSLFQISGRGGVLAGDILDGEIYKGDSILFSVDERPIIINSVEYVDFGKGIAKVGLMLGHVDADVQELLSLQLIKL